MRVSCVLFEKSSMQIAGGIENDRDTSIRDLSERRVLPAKLMDWTKEPHEAARRLIRCDGTVENSCRSRCIQSCPSKTISCHAFETCQKYVTLYTLGRSGRTYPAKADKLGDALIPSNPLVFIARKFLGRPFSRSGDAFAFFLVQGQQCRENTQFDLFR